MTYSSRIKADWEIFEKIRTISVGSNFILKPPITEIIDQESALYLVNSKTESVRKYLPKAYVENKEQAQNRLFEYIGGMATKRCIFYCIRAKERPFPIGYISLNSPLVETPFDSWMVEFWLGEIVQGQGIMTLSLAYILQYLQDNAVPEVKALVHPDNTKSIKVLEKVGFRPDLQEPNGLKRILYKIRLN